MAAVGACLLLLLSVTSAAPQGTPLSGGGGGGGGGGVVVKDILEKVLEAMQLRYIKLVSFCDADSLREKPPYTCLAKKLAPTACDEPIKAGNFAAFCQDDCPATFDEDQDANLYFCRKKIT